jgi:hypothetical protein
VNKRLYLVLIAKQLRIIRGGKVLNICISIRI